MSPNDKKTEVYEVSTDVLPKWLNVNYFDNILAKKFKQNYKIINMKTNLATAKGENFVSIMLRTNLDVQLADNEKIINLSYIVKALPDVGITEDIIKDFNVFPKEIEMYSKIIPGFEALLHEVGDEITFGPKYYSLNIFRVNLIKIIKINKKIITDAIKLHPVIQRQLF